MRCGKSGLAVLFAFFPVVFLSLALTAGAEDIDELKTCLKNTSYGSYWDRLKAVSSLGKMKTKEAASLLVTVLDDDDAPVREAAAMELGGFKDTDSIAIMCQAALRARTDTARAYAVWALGMAGQKDALETVVRAAADQSFQVRLKAVEAIPILGGGDAALKALTERLKDNAPAVRAAAIFALAVLKDSSAADLIGREIGDGNWQVHAAAVEATAIVKPAEISKEFIDRVLKGSDCSGRLAALNACFNLVIGQPGDLNAKKLFIDTAVTCLSDEELSVRAGAIRKLCLYRRKECIEPLMNRLGSETGRLRLDIVRALRQLTGKEIGFDARDWKVWWESNKDDFVMPAAKKGDKKSGEPLTADGSVATFFDIPIFSDRVVFIIDFSGSMKNAEAGGGDEAGTKDEKDIQTKAGIAIEQLCGALSKFKQEVRFNIIIMNTEAAPMKKRSFAENILVPATDGNKKRAKEYVEDVWKRLGELKRGRGDMYDCIAEAFEVPEADTVMILSDGKPTYGTYVMDDNIHENVAKINKYRNIAIHTVLTGKKGTDKKFMEQLAEDNMGIFVQK